MLERLKSTMDILSDAIISEPGIESAFIGALGNMEEIAAREIIKTIGPETPSAALLDIINHAQDEHRHAFQLRAIKPVQDYPDVKYYRLEKALSELGVNFVLGFFGQQLLLRARSASRFAGYVHGALTIEQVPLQMYTAYYKKTKNEAVRKGMIQILKDEGAHLALGEKFYATLSKEEQFSIDEINRIELEMCELLGRKMLQAITNFKNSTASEDTLEAYLCQSRKRLSHWIMTLAHIETSKGNTDNAKELAESVLFVTGSLGQASYVDMVKNEIQLLEEENLLAHYKDLSEKTNLIGVSYALEKVIQSYEVKVSVKAKKSHVVLQQVKSAIEKIA